MVCCKPDNDACFTYYVSFTEFSDGIKGSFVIRIPFSYNIVSKSIWNRRKLCKDITYTDHTLIQSFHTELSLILPLQIAWWFEQTLNSMSSPGNSLHEVYSGNFLIISSITGDP